MMKSLQRVKLSFGRSAKSYDLHGTLQKDVSHNLINDFIPATQEPPARILDVGCGTGFTSLEIKRRWPGAKLTAIDLAAPMARQTKQAGIENVAAANAALMPFGESSFDMVVSSLAFQWITADEALFPELAALLTESGRLYFSTLCRGTLTELRRAYDKACRECTGKAAVFPQMISEKDLMRKMESAGFKKRLTMQKTIVKSYPSVQSLLQTLKGVGATLPGRPANPPRRDVLARTAQLYPRQNGPSRHSGVTVAQADSVQATYEILYVAGRLA